MEKERCRREKDCFDDVPAQDTEHANPSRKGMGTQIPATEENQWRGLS